MHLSFYQVFIENQQTTYKIRRTTIPANFTITMIILVFMNFSHHFISI